MRASSLAAVPCGWGWPISSSMSANSWEGNTWMLGSQSGGEGRALFPGAGRQAGDREAEGIKR